MNSVDRPGYGSTAGQRRRAHLPRGQRRDSVSFDAKTGKQVWTEKLGTLQILTRPRRRQAGYENGKLVVRPHADKAEILDSNQLGTEDKCQSNHKARPAIARGRGLFRRRGRALRDAPQGHAATDEQRRGRGEARRAEPRRRRQVVLATPTEISSSSRATASRHSNDAVASPGRAGVGARRD